jgi:serine/threonine protein kinase
MTVGAIGPYEIQRELGRGGMGVVYLARHRELGRDVALKVTLEAHTLGAEALRRFEIEAQAVARLRHPGIVVLHELGVHGGRPFMAMDYVKGETLAARLRRAGPIDPQEAARLALALAEAVEHAHQQGILHRDLKPANILLDEESRPRITDFGLAKDLCASKDELTRTGQLLGTPAYMPPEQADGRKQAIGPHSDVYALGACLYAMLTGEPPFKGATALNVVNKVLTQDPSPPSERMQGVPAALDAVCLKCLAKDPAERYPSAAALATDLSGYLADGGVEARLTRPGLRLGAWGIGVGLVLLGLFAFALEQPRGSLDESAPSPAEPTRTPSSPTSKSGAPSGTQSLKQIRALGIWLAAHPDHPEAKEGRSRLMSALNTPVLEPDRVLSAPVWVPSLDRLLACGKRRIGGGSVEFLNLETKSRTRTLDLAEQIRWVAVDPQGKLAVTASWAHVTVISRLDLVSGEVVSGPPTKLGFVGALEVDWERGRVYAGSKHKQGGPVLEIDLRSLEPLRTLVELSGKLEALTLSPRDGSVALAAKVAGNSARIRLFDAKGAPGAEVGSSDRGVTALRYSPDGSLLAVGCRGGIAYLWNPEEGTEVPLVSAELQSRGVQFSAQAHLGHIVDLAFGESGLLYTLAESSAGDLSLRAWSLPGGVEVPDAVPSIKMASPKVIALIGELGVAVSSNTDELPFVQVWGLPLRQ